MWTTGIDCARFAFGIRLLQGPEIERDGDCIVTACLSQVLSDIWSLSVIINNDIVIIIYHHHQNHHHQHQLDKTIRVARVTTVVSHSAIIILRWRWGRSLILLQRRISGNGDSSSSASWGEARTPDDASQEAKTTGREYFLRAYHLDNLCSSKSDVRLRFWSWYDLKKLLWPSWTQHSGLLCLWQCLEISFLPSTSLHTAARHKGRQSGAIKSHFPTMRGKYVSIDN